MDEARANAFRSLKPPCVELSQLVLKFKTENATGKQIIKSIEKVHVVLRDVTKQDNVLNDKLADYAFFPLSHIFRDNKELPVRAVEIALQCLRLLICCGWRTHITPELGKQLLILLAILAGGGSTEAKSQNVNEELGDIAFQCLAALFNFTGNAGIGAKGSIKPENVSILGHAVTVVLEGVNDSPANGVKIAALVALKSIINGISDEDTLRSFFPGIVSSLTKALRPKSGSATSYKVLSSSLEILEVILVKVISDRISNEPEDDAHQRNLITGNDEEKVDPWVRASANQIKLALANVIPLRYHERAEVQSSLFQLCVSITQRCRKSLSQTIPMMVETIVALCGQEKFTEVSEKMRIARNLFISNPLLLEILKGSLHDWLVALPRIMQSNDDGPKQKGIDRISMAFQIISSQDANYDILNDTLAFNLRASICMAIQASPSQVGHPFLSGSLEVGKILELKDTSSSFLPILFHETSQKGILNGLQKLASQLKALPISKQILQGTADTIRTTSEDEQLASLWLFLLLLENSESDLDNADQYLNLPTESADDTPLDDVYSFALDILSKPTFEENFSWRLQALSLEVIVQQANRQKVDFRPELVDALYPILERMGSTNVALQHHAITSLNLVTRACDYPNTIALIIANADYLVNAVALKLNTFEISPQATLVLSMMVKLCGPALIPYLDDLVESIFAILACFHGYPRLVESLFSALRAIVEESGKSPLPAILPPSAPTTRQPSYIPTSIADLAARLRNLKHPRVVSSPPSSPPLEPTEDPPPPTPLQPEEDPPLPPSTKLLLSIAVQSQNHLNSPSPSLLLSLLSLLAAAFPPLTPYPTHLLPLLATTFPLLFPALHSPLPHISTAACTTLASACRSGGEFLATHIDDHWPSLLTICTTRSKEALHERTTLGHSHGPKHRAWLALTDCITAIVQCVGVRAEREDDVFDILAGERRLPAVRDCLAALNPDALWLVEMREGGEAGKLVPPDIEGWTPGVVEF